MMIDAVDGAIELQKSVKENFDITLDIEQCIDIYLRQSLLKSVNLINESLTTILEIARDERDSPTAG